MNSEDSADWTSDPEKRPLKRNECCHYVISVAVNKWNVECGKKAQYLSVLLIFDSLERPQFSEGLEEEPYSKMRYPLFGKNGDTYAESKTDGKS